MTTGSTHEDEWGEYRLDAGSTEPVSEEEVGYEPCNAVLKFTYSRYGEKRYCTGMSVGNFGDDANYEFPQFCKHHQSRHFLKEQQAENFEHGAYVRAYADLFDYLPPHKQVMAVDLYKSLLSESVYDFDPEPVVRHIDTTETFGKGSTVHVDVPVATEHRVRASALYFAALDFIKIQNITEEQFRVAFEETGPRGESLTVGEDRFERETESGETVEIKDEHHLNLPLSRIQKDYERHMKFGGVPLEGEADDLTISGGGGDWVLEIEEPEPETAADDTPLDEIEVPPDDDH